MSLLNKRYIGIGTLIGTHLKLGGRLVPCSPYLYVIMYIVTCGRLLRHFLLSAQLISRFQTLIFRRLDEATLHYMGEAEQHVDSETFNLCVEAGLKHRLKFCLWGNVVKDPRSATCHPHFRVFQLRGMALIKGKLLCKE